MAFNFIGLFGRPRAVRPATVVSAQLPRVVGTPFRHLFAVLAVMAVLMGSIDGTIMAVALPNVISGLNAPLAWADWTLTVYLLVQMVMLPVAGKLSDSLGRKRVFVFCVATFTLASALCGLAPNIGFLIAFRALQAIGGGGLAPSAIGIIADQYRERRAQALGLFTSVFPIGGIIGPVLGGFILLNWTWRELFWINVPIGLVVLLGVWRGLPREIRSQASPKTHIDFPGIALYGGTIILLIYPLTVMSEDATQVHNPIWWAVGGASVVLGWQFVRHIRRVPDAVMDYKLVTRNPFLAANMYSVVFGASIFGFFAFVPTYAVFGYGMDSFESGAVLLPRALVMLTTSTLTGLFINRLGLRLPLVAGLAMISVSLFLLSRHWLSIELPWFTITGFPLLAGLLCISGFGMGLANPAASNALMDIAPRQAGEISGIRQMFNFTGGSISLTAIGLVLSYYPDRGAGLATIYGVLSVLILVAVPFALMIPASARRQKGTGTPPLSAMGRGRMSAELAESFHVPEAI